MRYGDRGGGGEEGGRQVHCEGRTLTGMLVVCVGGCVGWGPQLGVSDWFLGRRASTQAMALPFLAVPSEVSQNRGTATSTLALESTLTLDACCMHSTPFCDALHR